MCNTQGGREILTDGRDPIAGTDAARRLGQERLIALCEGGHPPWRPIPSRMLARLLGVSLQTLANWRIRDTGPPCEGLVRGRGNRTYYRPDRVIAWLTALEGINRHYWEFTAEWLGQRQLEPANGVTEATIAAAVRALDHHF